MTYRWSDSYTRFEVASDILLKIMDSVYSMNNEIEFAVRAYGTQYPAQLENCIDTRLEVPFNLQNINQIKTRLKNLHPIGSSPIAYSLQQAAENELNASDRFDYSVILITDGGESCHGDVCGIYQQLLQRKISITPYIIGLDKNELLKSYYACLGHYMEVSNVAEIDSAVSRIVEANRPIIEKPHQFNLTTVFSNTQIRQDSTPAVVPPPPPSPDTLVKLIKGMTVLHLKKIPAVISGVTEINFPSHPFAYRAKKVVLQFEYEEAKKSSPAMMALEPALISSSAEHAHLAVKRSKLPSYSKAALHFDYEEHKPMTGLLFKEAPLHIPQSTAVIKSSRFRLTYPEKAAVHFEYEEHKKIDIGLLHTIAYPQRISYAFRMPDPKRMSPMKKPVALHFMVEEKKETRNLAKKDTILPVIPNNSIEFTTQVEANKETAVQVYFLGTNGKTYPTAKPSIEIQDAKTGKTITSFKRDVKNGEPVPQQVPPGTYNLVVKGFDDLYANNIKIEPNTVTKITVKVSDGTLQFRYQGNIKRPMKEYTAIVNRRFAAGATVHQPCSEARTYEPGTYYIEINSLPPYKASLDITFDASFEIQIPEPGTLAIMNDKPLGKIQIQTMLGDQFVTFYTMNITGNVADQRLSLLSNYPLRIVYPADPKFPQAGNKELPFRINPNNTLELELK